jgi:hypothetical protein
MSWRKWNRIIHRDFGYFFTGVIIIYAVSGIALNHLKDWNPNYSVEYKEFKANVPQKKEDINKEWVLSVLKKYNEQDNYKKHFFPNSEKLKVFLMNGSMQIDLKTGESSIEKLNKRFLIYQFNFLHYNPQRWWTWFSDVFAVALVIISITGLLIQRGKNGITGRGAWLTGLGILIPLLFLIFL